MPTMPLDSDRIALTFNGNVNPVMERVQNAEGRRVTTGVQESNEDGVPLWDVQVRYKTVNFGQQDEEKYSVRIPSRTEPQVQENVRARFKDLEVNYYAGRNGLAQFFNAAALVTGGGGEQK